MLCYVSAAEEANVLDVNILKYLTFRGVVICIFVFVALLLFAMLVLVA